MSKSWIERAVKFAMMAVFLVPLFIALFGFFVMHLWNWLMPALFGSHLVTFWQAVGILVLARILFGGFRGGRHAGRMHWRRRMMDRWENMTPEERENFSKSVRTHCGPLGRSTADTRV